MDGLRRVKGLWLIVVVLSAVLVVAVGCGGGGGTAEPTPTEVVSGGTPDGGAQIDRTLPPVAAAIEDLAGRFEAAPEEVEVLAVERAEWPDACLGVPQEDEACAQVITPGYEVKLRLGPNVYTYRTDETGANVRFFDVDVFADDEAAD
jgi:hypothetical protein